MLLISDANIFIDFECAGLTKPLFRLPVTIAVPDILFCEELEEMHSDLLTLGLTLKEVRSEYMAKIPLWQKSYGFRVSGNDYLALALAKQEQCPLVTGDMALRKVAVSEKVELRGTVYLMQQLVAANLVTTADIKQATERMERQRRRLPWSVLETLWNQ